MRPLSIRLAIASVIAVAAGCQQEDMGKTLGPNDKPDYDKQIRDIQANTHMPEAMKQIAIGQIKAHMDADRTQAPAKK